MITTRHDIFSLAGGRQMLLTHPPDLAAAEADLVCQWLSLVGARLKRLAAEPADAAELKRLNLALADRCHEQSEPLSRKAEAKPQPEPEPEPEPEPMGRTLTVTTSPVESTAWEPAPQSAPEPTPAESEPVATPPAEPEPPAESAALKAAQLIRAYAGLPVWRLANHLGVSKPATLAVLSSRPEWFAVPDDLRAYVRLTDAGKAALEETIPAPVETEPPEPATAAPEVETTGPVPETPAEAARPELTPAERAVGQCRAMAETIAEAGRPLDGYEIAKASGLPLEAVEKRLRQCGPSAVGSVALYFAKSTRDGGGKWMLTNSGEKLARGEAVAT